MLWNWTFLYSVTRDISDQSPMYVCHNACIHRRKNHTHICIITPHRDIIVLTRPSFAFMQTVVRYIHSITVIQDCCCHEPVNAEQTEEKPVCVFISPQVCFYIITICCFCIHCLLPPLFFLTGSHDNCWIIREKTGIDTL